MWFSVIWNAVKPFRGAGWSLYEWANGTAGLRVTFFLMELWRWRQRVDTRAYSSVISDFCAPGRGVRSSLVITAGAAVKRPCTWVYVVYNILSICSWPAWVFLRPKVSFHSGWVTASSRPVSSLQVSVCQGDRVANTALVCCSGVHVCHSSWSSAS